MGNETRICSPKSNRGSSPWSVAPNSPIRASGSTPLFLDFDIVTMPPDSTSRPSLRDTATRLCVAGSTVTVTSAGLNYSMRPVSGLRKYTWFSTIPKVNRLANGSLKETSPMSSRKRVQNLEYSKCRMACSMPPIY